MTIDYFSIGHPLSAVRSHYAWRARERMLKLFLTVFRPDATTRVLDLGITPDITLRESNHFEQCYPYPGNLTAASIEDLSMLRERFPQISLVQIPPDRLPFADDAFDIVFCSAVLEHVGDRECQRRFVSEVLRVGRGYFFTTPNRWFPVEFHTILPLLHWLPQPTHQRVLRLLGKEFWASTDNLNLLSLDALRALFSADASPHLATVRTLGWPSNLIAYGRR